MILFVHPLLLLHAPFTCPFRIVYTPPLVKPNQNKYLNLMSDLIQVLINSHVNNYKPMDSSDQISV